MPSTPPARRSTAQPSGFRQVASQALRLALLLIVAGLAVLYALTGWDPFQVFDRASATPTVQAASATALPPTTVFTITPTAYQPAQSTPLPQPTAQPASQPAAQPAPGSWWEVYFSDPTRINDPSQPAGSIEEQLLARINAARATIDIAAFEFNLDPVADALIAAHQRGVAIRWVTDDLHGLGADGEAGRGQFKRLQKAGIPVKADNRKALMHNKFLVFDNQVVWTGSTNLTINDNFRNNNNAIVIRSPELAAIYTQQFNDLWAGRFNADSPSTVEQQKLTIKSTPIQVLFSPEDDAISYVVSLVASAEKSIRFMAFSYTHDPLTEAMLERARAGVDIRGIFETRGSETKFSAMTPLFCAGVDVRQDGNPGTFHHKVIVVDGKILVTGSLNFSDNANDPNNENTLILMNGRIAALYLKEFERRWAETVPLQGITCR